jgi:hypothetical protein
MLPSSTKNMKPADLCPQKLEPLVIGSVYPWKFASCGGPVTVHFILLPCDGSRGSVLILMLVGLWKMHI